MSNAACCMFSQPGVTRSPFSTGICRWAAKHFNSHAPRMIVAAQGRQPRDDEFLHLQDIKEASKEKKAKGLAGHQRAPRIRTEKRSPDEPTCCPKPGGRELNEEDIIAIIEHRYEPEQPYETGPPPILRGMPLVNYWAADLDRADSIELLQAQGPSREGDYASWMESARRAVKDDGIIKESLSASPDDHALAAAARRDKRKDISSK